MAANKSYLVVFMIALSIFIVGIIGCGEDDEELYAEELSTSYLPINFGNWWKYIDPDYPKYGDIVTISGTRRLEDGKTVLVAEAGGEKAYISRVADNMILFHETLDDLKGELAYRPPLNVGTTWEDSRIRVEVASKEAVDTPAALFSDCYRLNVRLVEDRRYKYYSVWLARGVGPVKIAKFDAEYQEAKDIAVLESYNINTSKAPPPPPPKELPPQEEEITVPEKQESPPPKIVSTDPAEGQIMPWNASIFVEFNKVMKTVSIEVTDATGSVSIEGKTATWIPTPVIPPGAHTVIIRAEDAEGRQVIATINFLAVGLEDPQ